MKGPLGIVPTFLRSPDELGVTLDCLESIRTTEPELDLLVVDDGSPAAVLVDEIEAASPRLEFELHRKGENTGFSSTVNVGLRQALREGRDAILINADMRFHEPEWVEKMVQQPRSDAKGLAEVVGGLLLYPNDLIQHAGIFFSLLYREFDHIYHYAPSNLPEALQARVCPVTGALQFIRHHVLKQVGLYDEGFRLGWEDVDYCVRVFQAGGQCVYQPDVCAYHYESLFRSSPSPKIADWQQKSWIYFLQKHRSSDLAGWIPNVF